MIVAIVGIVHEYGLLPYYLQHYRELGVERFVIACNPNELDPSGKLERELKAGTDIELVSLPRGFQRSSLVGMIEEEVRARIANCNDWFIPADLDELNQYPCELRELIQQLEENGITHVVGELRDRLALGGLLTDLMPFDKGVTIWDQYPLEANVTVRVVGALNQKVLLSRGDLAWSIGHHRMRDPAKPFGSTGVAHHFKWRAGLMGILDWRVENESRVGVPWSKESIRLRTHLQKHGRINLEDVDVAAGWRSMQPVNIPFEIPAKID